MSDVSGVDAVSIRRLTPADLEAVAALEASVQIQPWSRTQILALEQLVHENYCAWVALSGGAVCGYLITQQLVDECEVLTIGVSREQQGQGIGLKLLQVFWQEVRSIDPSIQACFLEVRESNLAAQKLYSRFGFKAVGRRRNYYQNPIEDAVVMQKNDDQ